MTVLLLVGQAALAIAGGPCVCHADEAHHAGSCCCDHERGESCPCAPKAGDDGAKVVGACSHELLAVTARAVQEPAAGPSIPLPTPAILPTPIALLGLPTTCRADWHGPPLVAPRLVEIRTTILRI